MANNYIGLTVSPDPVVVGYAPLKTDAVETVRNKTPSHIGSNITFTTNDGRQCAYIVPKSYIELNLTSFPDEYANPRVFYLKFKIRINASSGDVYLGRAYKEAPYLVFTTDAVTFATYGDEANGVSIPYDANFQPIGGPWYEVYATVMNTNITLTCTNLSTNATYSATRDDGKVLVDFPPKYINRGSSTVSTTTGDFYITDYEFGAPMTTNYIKVRTDYADHVAVAINTAKGTYYAPLNALDRGSDSGVRFTLPDDFCKDLRTQGIFKPDPLYKLSRGRDNVSDYSILPDANADAIKIAAPYICAFNVDRTAKADCAYLSRASVDLDPDQPFTITFSFYWLGHADNNQTTLFCMQAAERNRWHLSINSDTTIGLFYQYGGQGMNPIDVRTTQTINTGQWYAVKLFYDGAGNWSVELDGQQVITASYKFEKTTFSQVSLGINHFSNYKFFKGYLSDFSAQGQFNFSFPWC